MTPRKIFGRWNFRSVVQFIAVIVIPRYTRISSMNSMKNDHVPGCGYCSTIVYQSTSHSFHLVTFAQSKCRWSILLDHQPTQEMAPSLHVLILRIRRILESTWRLQHAMLIFRIRRKKVFGEFTVNDVHSPGGTRQAVAHFIEAWNMRGKMHAADSNE